jgi:hypothetical protein
MVYKTIEWDIEAYCGRSTRVVRLPKSLYIPTAPTRVLCPQHWAKVVNDNKPIRRGTRCVTYDDVIILEWNQRKQKRTIPLERKGSNVAQITTSTGYKRYAAFCS